MRRQHLGDGTVGGDLPGPVGVRARRREDPWCSRHGYDDRKPAKGFSDPRFLLAAIGGT